MNSHQNYYPHPSYKVDRGPAPYNNQPLYQEQFARDDFNHHPRVAHQVPHKRYGAQNFPAAYQNTPSYNQNQYYAPESQHQQSYYHPYTNPQ
jgi:hypothetical protein